MKPVVRQSLLSTTVFVVVLGGLVSFDPRVRDRFVNLWWGANDLSPWAHRLADLCGTLVNALRYQTIENAPLVVFATIGAVLFLFMVKT
jgi:hypothetical protein